MRALFKKKQKNNVPIPPIPPIEEIAEHLYDKELPNSNGEIIKVIYSGDRTKRFVILKSNKGFYKYLYEKICVYDELDWEYFAFVNNAYLAWWEADQISGSYSFFGTEEEAMSALIAEPEYKRYFV